MVKVDYTNGCTVKPNDTAWKSRLLLSNHKLDYQRNVHSALADLLYIDQHTSRILCEHSNDGISWHYMTDREADMKTHINKLHESSLKEKLASNRYVPENACWSAKDSERSYKTFPQRCCGISYKLFIWVIMDTDTEDLRTKANSFSLPVYTSQD